MEKQQQPDLEDCWRDEEEDLGIVEVELKG